jgi:type I restriction enzyme, S subunit
MNNRYKKYKHTGVDWIGEIPEHWVIKKLSHGFKRIGSGTTPSSGEQDYYFNGEYNWLQTGDLNDGIILSTSKKLTEKALKDYTSLRFYKPNSLVIAMYGATIGKAGILNIETCTNQACCVLSEPISFVSKYVFYWFIANRTHIISLSFGGGQPNINQEIIRSLRIPCPSLEEQELIVKYLDEKVANIESIIKCNELIFGTSDKKTGLMQEFKIAIISEVVTGRIKVA